MKFVIPCLLAAALVPTQTNARTIIRANSPGANGMGGQNTAVGQTFGDNISLTAPGNAVFETSAGPSGTVGTPAIDLAWSAANGSNANRWEFHAWAGATAANSGGGVLQMDGSSLNSRFSVTLTPSLGIGVILNSFNFVGDTNGDSYQYRVDVVNLNTNTIEHTQTTALWTTATAQNPGTNGTFAGAPAVTLNFTGSPGVPYRLDLTRIGGSGSGSPVDIALDNLDFDQTAPANAGQPPVVTNSPAGPATTIALANGTYTVTAVDPENAGVQIQIDWGDGRWSPWSAAVASGAPVVFNRAYPHSGTFTLRARARDVLGGTSDWTTLQSVAVSPAAGIPDGLVGLWEFDNAGNLGLATYGTNLTIEGTPPSHATALADGRADPYSLDGVITTVGGTANRLRATHNIGANGYGNLVNAYSIAMDVLAPASGQWRSFWQTNTNNTDDGEFFIRNSDNTLGITGLGYSSSPFPVNQWRRVVVTADLTATGFYRVYLDGELFFTYTKPALDSRHALNLTQLLFHADENNENQPLSVGMTAMFSKALGASEVAALGAAGVKLIPTPGNQAPSVAASHTGPSTATTGSPASFVFLPDDPDGDKVQVQADWGDGTFSTWSPFGNAAVSRSLSETWNFPGTYTIKVRARDTNGATIPWVETGTVTVSGAPVLTILTPPYRQNMTESTMVIMAEIAENVPLVLQYGPTPALGSSVAAESVASGGNSFFYRGILTGLNPGTVYHFRFAAPTGEAVTPIGDFRTAPVAWEDVIFTTIGDVQTTNGNVWQADLWEPAKIMLADMVARGSDFAIGLGDHAQDGNTYNNTRNSHLNRFCAVYGTQRPFYISWGNHDGSSPAHPLRLAADQPSRWQTGDSASTRTPGYGNYTFTYSGMFFVCLEYFQTNNRSATDPANDITNGWLDSVLSSPEARQARFRIVCVHVPPFCERWIDGNAALRAQLVPRLEQHGVDLCLSGHMHGYERGIINGVHYVVGGTGSYLDFTEPLVANWSSTTDNGVWLGGHNSVAGNYARQSALGVLGNPEPIVGGLFHGYSRFIVRDRYLKMEQHAFNADGSYIGILDGLEIGIDPGPDSDGDGMRDAWETANGLDPQNPVGADGGDYLWPNGMTSYQHYLAGTDPRAAVAAFRVTDIQPSGPNVDLTWATVPGKRYNILLSTDLGGWTRVMDGNIPMEITATGASSTATIPHPGGDKIFVRIQVVP